MASRPRTFEEVVAAQSPDDRTRWDASETFNDGRSDVTVIQNRDGDWNVEWLGSDGECYVTVFAGDAAEARARGHSQIQIRPLDEMSPAEAGPSFGRKYSVRSAVDIAESPHPMVAGMPLAVPKRPNYDTLLGNCGTSDRSRFNGHVLGGRQPRFGGVVLLGTRRGKLGQWVLLMGDRAAGHVRPGVIL
jgi:hypothetical protein